MARKESRARGSLEHEVLLCLAAAKGPLTAADVQSEIGGLAYTTVMTTLSRLHAKAAYRTDPARPRLRIHVGRWHPSGAVQYDGSPDGQAARRGSRPGRRPHSVVAALKPEDEQLLTDTA